MVLKIGSRVGESGRAYACPEKAAAEDFDTAKRFYAAKGDPFAQTFATVEDAAAKTLSLPSSSERPALGCNRGRANYAPRTDHHDAAGAPRA